MKQLLVALLMVSAMLIAYGSQPLYIQNITVIPHGCTTDKTYDITMTAAGGAPSANGYSYTLWNFSTGATMQQQGSPSVTFASIDTATTYQIIIKPTFPRSF